MTATIPPTKVPVRAIGSRKFTWFTPAGRHATDYENLTIGQFSTPDEWLHVGWPVLFDDGRAPFTEDSTKIRSSHWRDWRDPFQVWQRPYVQTSNFEEQALERLVPSALDAQGLEAINETWLREVLGKYYAAWPFAEYGLFLSLCYAVREGLQDTVQFATAFEATDKLRHQQDIVRLILDISDRDSRFSDAGARGAWMSDPALVPTRENVERIFSLFDWAQMLIAINLAFEPLVGRLVKDLLVAHNAPYNGDPVSSMLLAAARRDTTRHLETTKSLVRFWLDDPRFGADNHRIIADWVGSWTAESTTAAKAASALFEIEGITVRQSASDAVRQVTAEHAAFVDGMGLT
ncbi:MAG: methane/phenol/Toluene hydroxylase [Candidatus Dormibacteraeota bacterium]|nr:methane/phenol/Toluene hydroxylase [Candidatus Dormibacteraeota bacterium]